MQSGFQGMLRVFLDSFSVICRLAYYKITNTTEIYLNDTLFQKICALKVNFDGILSNPKGSWDDLL